MGFYRYISSKNKTRENVDVINRLGGGVATDMERAEVINALLV